MNGFARLAVLTALVCGSAAASPRQQPQSKPAVLPTAEQLIAKYVRAVGGRAAMEKVHSRVIKGTLDPGGGTLVALELNEKAPDKSLSILEVSEEGAAKQGFDGKIGWQSAADGVKEISGEMLAAVRRNSQFYRWLRMKELFEKLEVSGAAKVGERDTFVMKATPPDGNPENFYFDAGTGLLLRRDYTVEAPEGLIKFETYYEDYRVVDGLKLAFTLRRIGPDGVVTLKYTEIRHNVELDDALFSKPSQP